MTKSPADAVSIGLVDDHRLFLMGFTLLLERLDTTCHVDAYDTPVALLKAVDDGEAFELVICDLLMSGMNGLAFIGALRSRSDVPVLMISGINSAPPITEMRQLNAQGFVHKSSDDEVLIAAIQTVLAGGTSFPDHDEGAPGQTKFGKVRSETDETPDVPVLTARQLEILGLISNGAANKEIARVLEISENTVKTHLKQIFELLRVNKRTACIRAAQSLGIL